MYQHTLSPYCSAGKLEMRCCGPGMLGAFAERVGAIDSMSGFIVVFIIALCVTAAWGDISKMVHLKTAPVAIQGPPEERI